MWSRVQSHVSCRYIRVHQLSHTEDDNYTFATAPPHPTLGGQKKTHHLIRPSFLAQQCCYAVGLTCSGRQMSLIMIVSPTCVYRHRGMTQPSVRATSPMDGPQRTFTGLVWGGLGWRSGRGRGGASGARPPRQDSRHAQRNHQSALN